MLTQMELPDIGLCLYIYKGLKANNRNKDNADIVGLSKRPISTLAIMVLEVNPQIPKDIWLHHIGNTDVFTKCYPSSVKSW